MREIDDAWESRPKDLKERFGACEVAERKMELDRQRLETHTEELESFNREFVESFFTEDQSEEFLNERLELAEESMPLRITKLSSEITDDDEWEWELEDVTRDINKLRIEIDMLVGLLAEKNDEWQDKEYYRQMIYREQLKKEKI